MWPILLDMTKEESMQHLRYLEIDAFSGLVSALRAQGSLDHDKLKILKDTGTMLHISQERHKAEIRRVVNDEKLNTIAYHINGEKHSTDEWAEEGQRLIPLIARVAPQTAFSAIADEIADSTSKLNKQLPSPSSTERKRPTSISPTQSAMELSNKNLQFRLNEPDLKKRKLMDGNGMGQHLMGPPKISKIQQIYRQKTKTRQRDQLMKFKNQDIDKPEYVHLQQLTGCKIHQPNVLKTSTKFPLNQISAAALQNSQKVNILQNISIPSPVQNEEQQVECTEDVKVQSSEAVISKATVADKKTIKVCAPRKNIVTSSSVTTTSGQKLIVVSNPQTLTTSSILQRTLTTVPLKNISVKNFDKFKIVTSTSSSFQTPIVASAQMQNPKQKVVSVRATAGKKVIPFSQVQVLNTKSGIKVLPLGSKIISKSSGAAPMGMNANDADDISSTSDVQVQESKVHEELEEIKEEVKSEPDFAQQLEGEVIEDEENVPCEVMNEHFETICSNSDAYYVFDGETSTGIVSDSQRYEIFNTLKNAEHPFTNIKQEDLECSDVATEQVIAAAN